MADIAPGEDPRTNPHPDYEHDDPGPGGGGGGGNAQRKAERKKFNKWWNRVKDRLGSGQQVTGETFNKFKHAMWEAWQDGYTPQQLNRVFTSDLTRAYFSNVQTDYPGSAGNVAMLEFLTDPEHADAFESFVDSIQPGGSGTQYVKNALGGVTYQEYLDAHGGDGSGFGAMRNEYENAFWADNPDLKAARDAAIQAGVPGQLQQRADARATQGFGQSPATGGVYTNINPEIPWSESLGPMGNILAGHAAQAFSLGDPDSIQNAMDRMDAYANWYGRFNSVFNPAAAAPPAPNTYITGFEYDDMLGDIN